MPDKRFIGHPTLSHWSDSQVTQSTTWTCPTCEVRRKARFCASCGEERRRPRDLTVTDLTSRFVENVSSIDGKLLRSFRSILTAPGTLTAAHIAGRRRAYLGPLALFFIANAVFVMLQSVLGARVLLSPLASHLHDQDWSGLAQSLVAHRLQAGGQTLAEYSAVFDEAVAFNAKALMILMVLAFVPLPLALFSRPRRPAGVHVVFSLHLYVFVLSLLCVSLFLAVGEQMLGGGGLQSDAVDMALSLFNLGGCGVYIYLALGPAYGSTGMPRVAKAAAMALAVGVLFVGYRFTIFLVTLYTT